jgi:uncharacterized protein YecT (DUF1311 family)
MQTKNLVCGIIFTLIGGSSSFAADKPSIRSFDFKHYFLTSPEFEYSECPENVKEICAGRTDTDYCPDGLSISVSYVETAKNASELAIVNGSSCFTGTAGPDIHAIYAMLENGQVKKIELPQVKKPKGAVFGNVNYDLVWEDGRLAEKYSDSSGRENPLIIRYQWKEGRFHCTSVEAAPMYKTSYDCTKAKEEHEQAICYVPELAKLDVRLDAAYKKRLAKLSASEKNELIAAQRQWITARNKKCTIYKGWVACLQGEYTKRIATLESPQ